MVHFQDMAAATHSRIYADLSTMFREHEFVPSRRDAGHLTVRPGETVAVSGDARILVRASNGMWRLPDGHPRIPLSFSVRAKKGA
jgi:hypothetical protein